MIRAGVAMDLEPKLKLALDETRLLILGAQVLFGFQFQAVFQQGFKDLHASAKLAQSTGLLLLLLAIALLIAPSMQHRIVYQGQSRRSALAMATRYSAASLLPLTLGLGTSVYMAFAPTFGQPAGLVASGSLTVLALFLLYGLGALLKAKKKPESGMPKEQTETPMKAKIEQLLTEARVIIPGGQALLGFQFVATLTPTFAALPHAVKVIHVIGLCAVAISVVVLMTPAALHRIAYAGEDDPTFYRIGSALVIGATWPLALGISSDVFVVFYVVSMNDIAATAGGLVSLIVLFTFWLFYPMWRRSFESRARPT